MSWQASRWARDQRTGSPAAKVVLMVLAEHAGVEDGACTLPVATIVERSEVCRRAVIQHLGTLESAGLIHRERRVDARGHRAVDVIRLALGEVAQGAPDAPRDDAAKVHDAHLGQGPTRGSRTVETKVQETHLGENPRCSSCTPKVHLVHSLGAADAPHIDKGSLEGSEKGSAPSLRKAEVDAFWAVTPRPGRERSSRKDIERALSSAVRRGHSAEDVLRGVKAYYASAGALKDGGAFAKGCHRVIENDRWEAFAPADDDDGRATSPVDPWRDRVKAFADPSNRYWNATDWGPAPGKPGCMVPAAILAEFGFGPVGVLPFGKRGAA